MGHHNYPVKATTMARVCRKMAADMRREQAAGMPPISMTGEGRNIGVQVSRLEAAASMDRQADRWEEECRTGAPNTHDRALVGA